MSIGHFYVSSDEERFDVGGFPTRDMAITDAPEELDLESGAVFWVGVAVPPSEDTPDGCAFGVADVTKHTVP